MYDSFLYYFYHDVQIKSIIYDFWQKDGNNSIIFELCILDDAEVEIDVKCKFVNIFDSIFSLTHNS